MLLLFSKPPPTTKPTPLFSSFFFYSSLITFEGKPSENHAKSHLKQPKKQQPKTPTSLEKHELHHAYTRKSCIGSSEELRRAQTRIRSFEFSCEIAATTPKNHHCETPIAPAKASSKLHPRAPLVNKQPLFVIRFYIFFSAYFVFVYL